MKQDEICYLKQAARDKSLAISALERHVGLRLSTAEALETRGCAKAKPKGHHIRHAAGSLSARPFSHIPGTEAARTLQISISLQADAL